MQKILRAWVALMIVFVLVLSPVAVATSPQDYDVRTPEKLLPEHLYGEYCIVMDADTGDILLEKNAYARCYPASTTKIMTCILGLELGPVGEMVTIPSGIDVSSDSSELGIKVGEVMNFTDLLYGMMLESGNDAALAVAILVSDTVPAFVKLMNEKAKALGMTSTNYVNPHGYHNVNHYTTAYDLTIVTRYALQNQLFRQIVSTYSYTLPPTNKRDTGLVATSEYQLLDPVADYYYQPCIGVKSGNTNAAGRCFVGAATQNGATLVSVTLKADTAESNNRYKYVFIDTIRLMKYGFMQYKALSFNEMYALCRDSLPDVYVSNVVNDDLYDGLLELDAVNVSGVEYREWYLERNIDSPAFLSALAESFISRYSFTLATEPLIAPIKQGNVVGTLHFEGQNGELLEGTLVASRDVGEEPPTLEEVMDTWIENNAPWLKYLIPRHTPVVRYIYWALIALIVFLIILRVRRVRAFNRRRRALIEKKRRAYIERQKKAEAARRAGKVPAGDSARTPERAPAHAPNHAPNHTQENTRKPSTRIPERKTGAQKK